MQNGKRLEFLYNDLSIAILSFEKSLDIDLKKFTVKEKNFFYIQKMLSKPALQKRSKTFDSNYFNQQ